MEQFFQFVMNHWPLWLLLVVIIGAIFHTEAKGQIYGVKLISTQELTEYLNHQDAIILDIREKKDFSAGHILGAMHIAESDLEKNMKKLQKYKKKPIIVVCEKGFNSPRAGSQLQKENFEQVFALRGGLQVWQSENLPLEV